MRNLLLRPTAYVRTLVGATRALQMRTLVSVPLTLDVQVNSIQTWLSLVECIDNENREWIYVESHKQTIEKNYVNIKYIVSLYSKRSASLFDVHLFMARTLHLFNQRTHTFLTLDPVNSLLKALQLLELVWKHIPSEIKVGELGGREGELNGTRELGGVRSGKSDPGGIGGAASCH